VAAASSAASSGNKGGGGKGSTCAATSETSSKLPYDKLQFTMVDCPGHASLIRTIIGGAQIIDIMLLVIDVNKGIQTQVSH
jgi:translation elongation factor EF-1alpha